MPTDLHYILYDTAPFNNVANTEFQLFKVAQGADATHTENYTNMRASGILPNEEKMVLKKIHAIVDGHAAIADIYKWYQASFLELKVNDQTKLKAPLAMFSSRNRFGGLYTQGTPANENIIGLEGDGFSLLMDILIPGGTSFFCRLFQGTALSGQMNIKIGLEGIYTLGG